MTRIFNFEIVAKRDFNVKYLFDDNKTVLSGNKSYQRCCHSSILFILVQPGFTCSKTLMSVVGELQSMYLWLQQYEVDIAPPCLKR